MGNQTGTRRVATSAGRRVVGSKALQITRKSIIRQECPPGCPGPDCEITELTIDQLFGTYHAATGYLEVALERQILPRIRKAVKAYRSILPEAKVLKGTDFDLADIQTCLETALEFYRGMITNSQKANVCDYVPSLVLVPKPAQKNRGRAA